MHFDHDGSHHDAHSFDQHAHSNLEHGEFTGDDSLTDPIFLDHVPSVSPAIHIDEGHLSAALDDAIARSYFDPKVDQLSSGWLSNLQGITAEYLVADALNHSGDGLSYHLFSDPSHPDADIAGVDANNNIVRLIQVKATSEKSYAKTGEHPGIELLATSDGAGLGMMPIAYSASALRSQITQLLS
jgi:hypothetical protein